MDEKEAITELRKAITELDIILFTRLRAIRTEDEQKSKKTVEVHKC